MTEEIQAREIDRISVVGGGDGGLLAALLVREFNPEIDITIYDDFSTSIPEVGKSTFIDIIEVLHDVLDIDEKRFIADVKPVWKTSAYFEDWCGHDPFHLPFDDASIIPSEAGTDRFETFYYRHENKNFNTLCAQLTEQKKAALTDLDLDEKYDCIAYQLNTGPFNEFLRDVCVDRGIELVDDRITDVVVSENEIRSIESEGSTYQSDLYIDATGFSRLLMENLDAEFLPFEFPLDSALVTKIDIPPSEIVPATVIKSGTYGWSWQIDTFDYRDLGYVYSSTHASPDEAMNEFLRLDERVSRSDVQRYSFESGVYRKAWVSNCVAVGNASGFVEPLTATAITLGANLSMKFSELLADHHRIDHRGVREIYNSIFRDAWDNVRNYIELLYSVPSEDNEFWNEMQTIRSSMLDRDIQRYHQNGLSSHYFFDSQTQTELFPFDQWDVFRLLRNLGVTSDFHEEIDVNVNDEIIEKIQQRDRQLDEQIDNYLTYEEASPLFDGDDLSEGVRKSMNADTEPLTVVEQIDRIANRELEPDYFQKRTREGAAEAAMRARIERDDRILLVCRADETITEIDDTEALYRTDEILGFAFFGTYTAKEMDEYMEVPLEKVFAPDDFPVGHFRNLTIRGDAQGGQISSRMIGRIIEGLYELGQSVLVVLLRDRHDIDTPDYAEDFGAEQVGEFEDYFDDRICTICESDCECTFVFYKMEIG